MKLLAIDPGLSFTGYALYVKDENKKIILLKADVIKIKSTLSIPAKLKFLYDIGNEMICDHEVTDLALETPFLGKNAATFAKLGYIRSVLYLLSEVHDLSLHEFPPQVVKKAVTGDGRADKVSVARVMRRLYPQLIDARCTDVTDAAAVGACAIYLMR
jgi:crossover junction endodeoxyribonuclease RuvC